MTRKQRVLLLKIIDGIKRVINNSGSFNYTADMYIDFGVPELVETSIVDIAYKHINEMLVRLKLGETIYISRIIDMDIDNKPIILFTTNPSKHSLNKLSNAILIQEINDMIITIEIFKGKVGLIYDY